MKLATIRTYVVGNPPPSFGGRYFVFCELETDDGVVGLGEVYAATFHPRVIEQALHAAFERHLLDADPFGIETLWRRLYASGYTARPDATLGGVMSGLEMACWDIIGKAVERPVHALLGGLVHERLRGYTYLYTEADDPVDVYLDPTLAAERAATYAGRGHTALKFDPAGTYSAFDPRMPELEALDRSEAYVAAVREAVGSRCDLLFGTHGQFTAAGAIRLARRLERFDPLWFEEPVPPDLPEEMATVARATTIPIATGERLTTKVEFARVLALGAARILQPNLGRAGGLLEGKKIASIAEAHYAQIAPHLYCGPVVGAANIQLAACSPNFLVLEGILEWGGFHAQVLKQPIHWEAGYVTVPTSPGLGVELDHDVVAAHPYEGADLHLEAHDAPLGYP